MQTFAAGGQRRGCCASGGLVQTWFEVVLPRLLLQKVVDGDLSSYVGQYLMQAADIIVKNESTAHYEV